ncbi:MAG: hypothetical protein EXR65_02200 [Dehalococcoidia bacterium]|nr:hypothetical protein [Dehalococcoidia bacterium]
MGPRRAQRRRHAAHGDWRDARLARWRFLLSGRERTVVLEAGPGDAGGSVTVDDGAPVAVELLAGTLPGLFSLQVGARRLFAYVARRGQGFEVTLEGRRFVIEPASSARRGRGPVAGLTDLPGRVTAPLPGVVVAVHVAVGDRVAVAQPLLVVEAMKMQNEVQARYAGVVTAVHATKGDRVEKGGLLVEYTPDDPEAGA